jgi:hypothetical protein
MDRLGGSVRRALRGAGVPDAGALAEVTRAWPEAVGPAIARAAWPQRIGRDGTLHVTTVSSTWAFELGRMEPDVREKLAAAVGKSAPPALRFAPGPVPEPAGPERPRAVAPAPTEKERSEATALSSSITDPVLRDAVQKAISASLARGRGDRPV